VDDVNRERGEWIEKYKSIGKKRGVDWGGGSQR